MILMQKNRTLSHEGKAAQGPSIASESTRDLFNPPDDIYELSANAPKWDMATRAQTLMLQQEDPTLLKASLRHWVLTAVGQASRVSSGIISTRRLSHIIFGFHAFCFCFFSS